jgi:serine/threonine protein kinase
MRRRTQPARPASMSLMGMYSSVGDQDIGHYRILQQVGHGGMGQVYRARDLILDRVVALKFLPPWRMGNAAFRKRLKQEAKRASALNHPNIVTIHEFGEYKGIEFIVMEFVGGQTLTEVLSPKGITVELATHYALQIADALATAHLGGILHRDLKPRNIMVTGDGRVKLLDFGLATVLTSSSTPPEEFRAAEPFGTRIYMAPEQLRTAGGDADPRSEVFSFGLILHEMLHGAHPFGLGARQEILDGILYRDPAPLPSAVPDAIAAIVMRCLQKTQEQRFGSAQELLGALRQWHTTTSHETTLPQQRGARRSAPGELAPVRRILANVTYENLSKSKKALEDLERIMEGGAAAAVRGAVTSALKEVILTLKQDANGVTSGIREIRKRALDVLIMSADRNLNSCFGADELAHLDL